MIASPPVQPISASKLGHRLGQHDIAAEGREQPRRAAPSLRSTRSSRRRPRRASTRPWAVSTPSRVTRERRRSLVEPHARRERLAAKRADEPGRLDGGAVAVEDAAAEERRAAARRHLVPTERDRLAPRHRARARPPSIDRGSRRAPRPSRLEAALLREATRPPRALARRRSRRRRRARPRAPRRGRRARTSGQARPVAVEEATVPSARTDPATFCLEYDDVEPGARSFSSIAVQSPVQPPPTIATSARRVFRRAAAARDRAAPPGATRVSRAPALPSLQLGSTPRTTSGRGSRRCGRTPPGARRAAARSG